MSKKLLAILITISVFIIGIWIWTFASINKTPIIIGGSTSANSFMQRLTTKIKNYDYTYNSTGSQNGVNGVFSDVYVAGVISKEPDKNGYGKNNWSFFDGKKMLDDNNNCEINNGNFKDFISSKKTKKNDYTATQLAIDVIVIIYNLPQKNIPEVNFETSKDNVKDNVVKKIYENKIQNWNQINQTFPNLEIKPFTRENGSGTKTSFEEKWGIADSSECDVVNSNGMMLNSVQATAGSIGFLSLPFIEKITSNDDVFVAGVDGKRMGYSKDKDTEKDFKCFKDNKWENYLEDNKPILNSDAVKKDLYNFTRPFVMIYKNSNINFLEPLFNFIINDSKSDDMYKQEGVVKKIVDFKIK